MRRPAVWVRLAGRLGESGGPSVRHAERRGASNVRMRSRPSRASPDRLNDHLFGAPVALGQRVHEGRREALCGQQAILQRDAQLRHFAHVQPQPLANARAEDARLQARGNEGVASLAVGQRGSKPRGSRKVGVAGCTQTARFAWDRDGSAEQTARFAWDRDGRVDANRAVHVKTGWHTSRASSANHGWSPGLCCPGCLRDVVPSECKASCRQIDTKKTWYLVNAKQVADRWTQKRRGT
eukprot:357329-Chlamydomonas_euryale.AAC.2